MKKIYLLLFAFLSIFLVACNRVPSDEIPDFTVKYDVTFMLDDSTVYETYRLAIGADMQYPADPVKNGFTFTGWYVGNEEFTSDIVLINALTLYAHFEVNTPVLNTYTVTFYDGDEVFYTTNVEKNKKVTDSIDTTKEHYTFEGWFLDSEFETSFGLNNSIWTNLNLYGKWVPILYTVNFYRGLDDFKTEIVESGQSLPEIETEIEGYEFVGWYTNLMLSTPYTDAPITSNLSLYGKWNEIEIIDPVDPNPDNTYTGYYASLNGLNNAQLKTTLTNMIKNTGIANGTTGSTSNVQNTDKWNGSNYNIYTGFGSYGNREHVVPASKLRDANAPEYDLHNLRAAVISVNTARGNDPFGPGTGSMWKSSNSRFYPGSEHLGDAARIVFYITTRYNVPISAVGDLDMLLEWHAADPVNEFETIRNNRIYNIQSNRNPFIDHPELVQKMWGSSNNKAHAQVSFDVYIPSFTFNQIFAA